eukprot:CAMPEP_0204276006 /NCGR_PEP_ID=MMETSP0468-20130131/27147_1 /ASSEMBLY_ACC=CAM_ASM_000383 /TAXON_ID=2969 /ORGANISM="Oxyrrhis marina" /LENGTH=223 /DNA_ID=CAMNT_0051252487 /DNA_START=36 /DNA_END=707 /DNA_ORIENTATION=+
MGAKQARLTAASRSVIVFDWDDTLLPTTAIQASSGSVGHYESHTRECIETLVAAQAYGEVVIVTAAEDGWVEASCELYMPELYDMLFGPNATVLVVSSKAMFQPFGYHTPGEWKRMAFTALAERYRTVQGGWNFVSIGDAQHERQALLHAAPIAGNAVPKCVKLSEKPTLEHLSAEIRMVREWFASVMAFSGPLDLKVDGVSGVEEATAINCPVEPEAQEVAA